MERRHLIDEIAFDISFDAQAQVFEHQDDIRAFVCDTLLPVIDKVCSSHSDAGSVLRVESIEIDLGDVPVEDFEIEMVRRLRDKLSELLADIRRSSGAANAVKAERVSRRQAEFEQLEYFLLHGSMPWHTDAEDGHAHERLMESVLRESGAELAALLKRAPRTQRGRFIERLVRQFPERHLAAVLRQMEPSQADTLLGAISDMRRVFAETGRASAEDFRLLWEQAMLGASEISGKSLDGEMLIDAAIRRIASAQGESPNHLFAFVSGAAQRLAREKKIGSGLSELFESLHRRGAASGEKEPAFRPADDGEPGASIADKAEDSAKREGDLSGLEQRVAHALLRGDASGIRSDWARIMKEHPGLLKEALRRYGTRGNTLRRLAAGFPESMLIDLVRLSAPMMAGMTVPLLDTEAFWQAAGTERGIARQRLWEFVLGRVSSMREEEIVAQSYAQDLLKHMAQGDHGRLRALTQAWREAADDVPHAVETLDDVLSSLPASQSLMRLDRQAEERADEDEHRSEAIVRGYDLYEALHRLLAVSGEEEAESREEEAIAVIAELEDGHAMQLRRFFREMRDTALHAIPLTGRTWQRLVHAFIGQTPSPSDGERQIFLASMEEKGREAKDRAVYFRLVLECLLHDRPLDLEEIAERRWDEEAGKSSAGVSSVEASETDTSLSHRWERGRGRGRTELDSIDDAGSNAANPLPGPASHLTAGRIGPTGSGGAKHASRNPASAPLPREGEQQQQEQEQGQEQQQEREGATPAEAAPASSPEEAVLRAFMRSEGSPGIKEMEVLRRAVETLLEKRSPALKAWFEQSPQSARRAVRLSRVLPERLLTRLLLWLRSDRHADVQDSADSVAEAFADEVKGIDAASVAAWKWEYILGELFEKRQPFEREGFMQGLAQHLVGKSAAANPDTVRVAMQARIAKSGAPGPASSQDVHIASALENYSEQMPEEKTPHGPGNGATAVRRDAASEAAGRSKAPREAMKGTAHAESKDVGAVSPIMPPSGDTGKTDEAAVVSGMEDASDIPVLVPAYLASPEAYGKPPADSGVGSATRAKADASARRDRIMRAVREGDAAILRSDWEPSMREHPEILREALHRHAVRDDVRQRLADRFPDAMLLDMVWLLEPRAAECMALLLDHPEPFMQAAGGDWQVAKRRLWAASFEHVLDERGVPDMHLHVRRLMTAMAGKGSAVPQALVRAWNETVSGPGLAEESPRGESPSAQTHLSALAAETGKSGERKSDAPISEAGTAANDSSGPELRERQRLSTERSKEDSDRRSEAIVRGYDLYEALHRLLAVLDEEEAVLRERETIAVIDELTGRHAIQLRRFFRALRDTALPAMPLTAPVWQRLAQAFIEQMPPSSDDGRQAFLASLAEQSRRAESQAAYFRQVLECLLHDVPLDLEEIVERSRIEGAGATAAVISHSEAEEDVRHESQLEGTASIEAAPASSSEEAMLRAFMRSEGSPGIEEMEVLRRAVETLLEKRSPALKAWFEQSPQVARRAVRLSQVLPERLLTRLLLWLRSDRHADVQDSADSVAEAFADEVKGIDAASVAAWKWEYVLGELFEKRQPFEREGFMQGLAQHLVGKSAAPNADTIRATIIKQALSRFRQLRPPSVKKAAASRERSSGTTKESVSHEPVPYRAASEEADPAENLYIRNAGQVLAAPYLPRLFTMLNMVEKGKFVDREAAERAAHLLQFMVNESTDSPEYQLVLNKLLCGVKTGVPIVHEIEITGTEKDAIEGLLNGMIQNWKALGNTSIKGLREAFLQREGWLRLKDDAWYLEVLPGTFDMLLDRLPWGFSVIKYPWMERPVHVTWR